MSIKSNYVPIPGSERVPLQGAHSTGRADPNKSIRVTVRVRPRTSLRTARVEETATRLPHERQYMSHEEYEKTHGAESEDLKKVEKFAQAHGLEVVESHAARRSVVLSGTVAAFSDAFDVQLDDYEYPGGTYRGRTGHIHVPAELQDIVEGVFGLDNRPQAQPHLRLRPQAEAVSYTPLQLAQFYNFPTGTTGEGQCIAIIELGGGYTEADLTTYFNGLGIQGPQVSSISVDNGENQPTGDPNGPDGEVLLDIEVAGAVAPQAQIAVYFAPNTDQGFLDAITTAIHDTQRKPSVISISWGSPESQWTPQTLDNFNQAFQAAGVLGITVCCAAGDNGSSDGINDGKAHVDFPASSPYVLSCGGTRLTASDTTISQEVVWNEGNSGGATGGGVSDVFILPDWQSGANVPASVNSNKHVGRGVPDVSGDADPNTGYRVRVDGQDTTIGGTSAVAPLWAGLIALLNQKLGHPVGYLNPLLYKQLAATGVCRDITKGNNDITGNIGGYSAGQGWDACTGWGSPDGKKLLQELSAGKS